jgi:hypothetical protein
MFSLPGLCENSMFSLTGLYCFISVLLILIDQFSIVLSNITAFATLRSLTLQICGPHRLVSF